MEFDLAGKNVNITTLITSETDYFTTYGDKESLDKLHVRSSMTGREYTIHRSEVSRLVGNYISQSDIDPTLADMPVMSR